MTRAIFQKSSLGMHLAPLLSPPNFPMSAAVSLIFVNTIRMYFNHILAIVAHIIRQGRCTLVATVQMYKILALNCLISAYALSVQYLDGIKYGDYQVTITGMLMSVCFLCISRARVGLLIQLSRILADKSLISLLKNFRESVRWETSSTSMFSCQSFCSLPYI